MNNPYINYDSAKVDEVVQAANQIYTRIKNIIKKINEEKAKLSTIWASSAESKTFDQKLAKVYADLQAFEKRYDAFMDFISQTTNIYSQSSDSIVRTINSVVSE